VSQPYRLPGAKGYSPGRRLTLLLVARRGILLVAMRQEIAHAAAFLHAKGDGVP
jgi:hypothetical protein